MLELRISGTYRTQAGVNGEIADYENVVVKMPVCDEYKHQGLVQRLADIAILEDPRYKGKRCETVRETFIDSVKDLDEVNPIIGKDIKEFTWKDIQFLAIMKNLVELPTHKQCSIREAREKTYKIYSEKVLLRLISDDIMWNDLPALCVKDDGLKAHVAKPISEDEAYSIDMEEKQVTADISMEELKSIASRRGVQFHPAIGYDKLRSKLKNLGFI